MFGIIVLAHDSILAKLAVGQINLTLEYFGIQELTVAITPPIVS